MAAAPQPTRRKTSPQWQQPLQGPQSGTGRMSQRRRRRQQPRLLGGQRAVRDYWRRPPRQRQRESRRVQRCSLLSRVCAAARQTSRLREGVAAGGSCEWNAQTNCWGTAEKFAVRARVGEGWRGCRSGGCRHRDHSGHRNGARKSGRRVRAGERMRVDGRPRSAQPPFHHAHSARFSGVRRSPDTRRLIRCLRTCGRALVRHCGV